MGVLRCAALLALAQACAAPVPPSPDASGSSCHYDCFGRRFCVDGNVWEVFHAPVPCSSWTGRCPGWTLGTCPAGCSDRAPSDETGPWELFCEGSEEHLPGDLCMADQDCQPPVLTSPRSSLGCDTSSSVCVVIDPPSAPPDLGAACSVDLSAFSSPTDGTAYGVAMDAACSTGWCRFLANEPPACNLHGCAIPCEDMWDCPPDLDCVEEVDWTGRRVGDGQAAERVGVCRTNVIYDGIGCH